MRVFFFVNKFVDILSLFYPLRFFALMKLIKKNIYSAKIRKKIGYCGETFKIKPPIFIKGGEYMKIGLNFHAGKDMILQCWDHYENDHFTPCLEIGDNVSFGDNCHIGCVRSIKIGHNLLAGRNVYITDHSHGMGTLDEAVIPPCKRSLYVKGTVEIGNNVWLGENSVILPNVNIGNNVTVGANAVVTKDLPDNCVAAGVPAKVIRIKQ